MNPGHEALAKVRSDLMMDDDWTVQTDQELTWWGWGLPLAFKLGPPLTVDGDQTVPITVSVDLVRDVQAEPRAVLETLESINRISSVVTYTFLPETRVVKAHYGYNAYDGNGSQRLFAPFSLLTYTEACARAGSLAEMLDGSADAVPHPTGGIRNERDELLTFTETTVVPGGRQPNRFAGPSLEHLAEFFMAEGWGVANGDPHHVTLEPALDASGTVTALVQLFATEHTTYGQGLQCLLMMPSNDGPDPDSKLANDLNLAELNRPAGLSGWGAWCTPPGTGLLAHTGFVPNVWTDPGIASTVAMYAVARARTTWELLQQSGSAAASFVEAPASLGAKDEL